MMTTALKTPSRVLLAAFALAASVSLAACGGSTPAPPAPPAAKVTGLAVGTWVVTPAELEAAYAETAIWGEPVVRVILSPEGAARYAAFAAENVGKAVGIAFDGRALSQPIMLGPVNWNEFSITGPATAEEATAIATTLNARS
jgi:preprotein translocase subunit SecD